MISSKLLGEFDINVFFVWHYYSFVTVLECFQDVAYGMVLWSCLSIVRIAVRLECIHIVHFFGGLFFLFLLCRGGMILRWGRCDASVHVYILCMHAG